MATTGTQSPAPKDDRKTARIDAKLPVAVGAMLDAAAAKTGRGAKTAIFALALEAYAAAEPSPASMMRARVLLDGGFMATGRRKKLFTFSVRATPDQVAALAHAAYRRRGLQDLLGVDDVAAAAIADRLAGSPAHGVLVHAGELLAVCGIDIRDLLNERGVELLNEDVSRR
ncbi:MAG: hypothetical protein HHJ14_02305 [Cellulomonas sp.]|nr:hypothetical protein [Cellulomonas sp.]